MMVKDATGKDMAVYLERHGEGPGDEMKEGAMILGGGGEGRPDVGNQGPRRRDAREDVALSLSWIPTGAGGRSDFFQDDLAAEALSLLRAASSVVSVTGLRWRTFVP